MFLIKCSISFPSSIWKTADSSSGKQISVMHPFASNVVTVSPYCTSVYFFIYFVLFFFFLMKKIDQMYFSLSFLGRTVMSVIALKCLYCGNVEWLLLYQVTIQHKQKVYRLKYHYYLFPAINSNSWGETIFKMHLESQNKLLFPALLVKPGESWLPSECVFHALLM